MTSGFSRKAEKETASQGIATKALAGRASRACALVAGLTFAASSQAEFIVDGILTPGADADYQEFELEFVEESGAVGSGYFGKLWVGFGRTAMDPIGTNDIFILLEVPTEIQDLTYGANASWGWYDTSDPDPNNWDRSGAAEYDRVQGSENWSFCFGLVNDSHDDQSIKIQMKDTKSSGDSHDGLPPGYKIDKDDDNVIVAASTSLDYNLRSTDLSPTIAGDQVMTMFTEDSPFCGDVTTHTSDQDCYDELEANYEEYQFAQRYEVQIDNSMFALSDVNEVFEYINNSTFHASRPKYVDDNTDFTLPCLDPGGTCDPVNNPPDTPPPAPGIPLPSSLSLFALAGAVLVGRRRKQGEHN